MLLGKRSRPSMRRTTSMTEFEPNLEFPPATVATAVNDKQRAKEGQHQNHQQQRSGAGAAGFPPAGFAHRNPRRSSADFLMMEGADHFLRSCTLCKRRIGPGRDIYMYRGDTAYCSLECRQQQMNIDDRKEKCSMASIRKEACPAGSEPSSNVIPRKT